METIYFINKREPCPKCKGEKKITHPHWEAFWKEHGIQPGNSFSMEQAENWFLENYGDAYLPDEEIDCDECEARGFVESEVDLREALEAINGDRFQVIANAMLGRL